MATTLQRRTTKRSDAPKFFCSHILFLFLSLQFFTTILQKAKNKKNAVQFQRRRPYSKLREKHIKGRRGLKGPPATDRAERLTLFRESRPTPPTAATAPALPPPTMLRTIGGKCVYYGWLAVHTPRHMLIIERTVAPPLPAGT